MGFPAPCSTSSLTPNQKVVHWETKIHVAHFVLVFGLLQWSESEPTRALRYAFLPFPLLSDLTSLK